MRNSGKALRTAYFTKLNGQVTVRGVAVPVYADDRMVSNPPYIFLGPQTATDISGKDGWSDARSITIDIVTSSAEGIGGPAESEDIADQICQLIATADTANWPDPGADFKITTLEKVNEIDRTEGGPTETVYRKILTFRHQIHER